MQFLIVLALTLATCFALPGSKEIKSRNIVVPAGRPEGRITRGKDAKEKEFPYQVGLSLKDQYREPHWCGGSLLNNEWVLTAAHCTKNRIEAMVLLGATDRHSAEVVYQVTSDNFLNHEDYNDDTIENDIALIKIPYTKYTDKIQPVRLPDMAESYASYAGEGVIASGWGHTSDSAFGPPDRLQWAHLSVIPNNVCNTNFTIKSSNICTATVDGVNICDGDSGGPIVLEASKVQIGLTSFGSTICLESRPAVFTRVTSFLQWIRKHTKNA